MSVHRSIEESKLVRTLPKRIVTGISIFASAKEVMFLPDFVCLSVCLSVCLCVSKITQKVMDGSF